MSNNRIRQLLRFFGGLCLAIIVTSSIGALAADNFQHVIVATQNGDVNEVFFRGGQTIGQDRLSHFDGIVGVAGYFAAEDNYQHVIVATKNGDVNEVFFKGGQAKGQGRLAHFDGIVGVVGYFAVGDYVPVGSKVYQPRAPFDLVSD